MVRLELLTRTNVKNEAHEHPIRLRRATVKAGHGCHRPGLRPDGKVVDLAEDGLKRAIVRAVDSPVAILMSGLKGSKDVIDLVLMVGG